MSYNIYTTNGLILRRTNFGEADVLLHILTENLGLIIASARGARLSVSKLRPALQEYSLVTLSCVRGKGGWKITNVSAHDTFYFNSPKATHKFIARLSLVLQKMITGESPHSEIFSIVKSSLEYLRDSKEEYIEFVEILTMLRILMELGYVDRGSIDGIYFQDISKIDEDTLLKTKEDKKIIIPIINKALKASQL